MRGANFCSFFCSSFWSETSPHAWSKLSKHCLACAFVRNISTCVEQTPFIAEPGLVDQKHLHMRGANYEIGKKGYNHKETSPHAWSKLISNADISACNRNISTCVEQTLLGNSLPWRTKKHLHMRGANLASIPISTF